MVSRCRVGVLAVDPLLQYRHLGPDLVECLHFFGGQRVVHGDEQLSAECVRQSVDAVVVERTGQVLRHRHIVVGVVGLDDDDHLVGHRDRAARVT